MALTEPSFGGASPLLAEVGPSYRAGQENSRLQAIAEALPDARYDRALALGATHGVTRKFANRCERIDFVVGPWRSAPGKPYDLVIACDALSRLEPSEREAFLTQALIAMKPGGHLVLAHWLDEETADEIAAEFIGLAEAGFLPVSRRKTPHYRVDVLERG